jgi:hypothetical protein
MEMFRLDNVANFQRFENGYILAVCRFAYSLLHACFLFELLIKPQDGDDMFLRNVDLTFGILHVVIDRLRTGRPRCRSSSPGRVKNFLFSKLSRPALGSTQPPIQWVPWRSFPGGKVAGA